MKNNLGKSNYAYLLLCSDGTLYGGWTTDLEARLEAHNSGMGAKYTRGRRPVTLAYHQVFDTKQEAMKREWQLKHMKKEKKLALIESYQVEKK